MKVTALKMKIMKSGWPLAAACLVVPILFLGLVPVARAQLSMGDAGIAMGAGAALGTTPLAAGAQATQQAVGIVTGQPAAAATPPAAAGTPATTPTAAAAATPAPVPVVIPAPAEPAVTDLHAPFVQSLFFSPQDIIAIKKASEARPDAPVDPVTGQAQTPVIPMNRFISVSGISYKSSDNWVVWINGRKIVKGGEGALKELVEIKPQKDYVDLLWFDIGLNGTIRIKMRPNQTYYIVPGLLLPGVAVP